MRSSPFVGALAIALLGWVAPDAALAGETVTLGRADAPIKEVTVYAGQALVKRLARYEAKAPGEAKVVLAKLPSCVADDSVRVRAEAGTLLLGSRVVAHPVRESSLPAFQAINDEVRALDRKRRELEDRKELANAQIAHVQAVQKAQASEESRWLKAGAGELTALADWATKALGDALSSRRQLDQDLEEVAERRALAMQKLAGLSVGAPDEKDVEIELVAQKAGSFRIEVEYVTSGASWTPFYDLRADGDAKAIDVTYYGVIRQTTGEDWEGVKLALSTARPELGARPPDLAQLGVGMRPRYGSNGWRVEEGEKSARAEPAKPAETAALYDGATAAAAAEGIPAFARGDEQRARAESRGATVAFQIPSAETIPADGKEKRATIGKSSWKAENRYVTVPKVSPFAYLRSSVQNAFSYPLLAGEANVFFGPDYVGKSRVELVPAGEKMDVYLGVDERVRVERKTEKRFRDTQGIFSTDVRERYEFKVPIKNTRDVPIQITVVDQVPVSTHEDVRVEDVSWSPEVVQAGADKKPVKGGKDDPTGERRWELTIPAKGEASVALKYTVRFPEKEEVEVIGMER